MDRILIVITGIGEPYYSEKLKILKNNIERLLNKNYKLDILISLYSINNKLKLSDIFNDELIILDNKVLNNETKFKIKYKKSKIKLKIIKEQNYVGEFILKYVIPNSKYKYVILLLDDIELNDTFNLENIITVYNNTKFPTKYNILSPTLTLDSVYSHEYMLNNFNSNRIVNKCEYFFYLMNYKSYKQYYSIFTDNPNYIKYMWGIDIILYLYNISSVLLNNFTIKHYYTHGPGKHANKCAKYMRKLIKNVKKLKK
jgi:hypothetical protein